MKKYLILLLFTSNIAFSQEPNFCLDTNENTPIDNIEYQFFKSGFDLFYINPFNNFGDCNPLKYISNWNEYKRDSLIELYVKDYLENSQHLTHDAILILIQNGYIDLSKSLVSSNSFVNESQNYNIQVEIIKFWKFEKKVNSQNNSFKEWIETCGLDFNDPIIFNYAFSDPELFKYFCEKNFLSKEEIKHLHEILFTNKIMKYLNKNENVEISPDYKIFFANYYYFLNHYHIRNSKKIWNRIIKKVKKSKNKYIAEYLETFLF